MNGNNPWARGATVQPRWACDPFCPAIPLKAEVQPKRGHSHRQLLGPARRLCPLCNCTGPESRPEPSLDPRGAGTSRRAPRPGCGHEAAERTELPGVHLPAFQRASDCVLNRSERPHVHPLLGWFRWLLRFQNDRRSSVASPEPGAFEEAQHLSRCRTGLDRPSGRLAERPAAGLSFENEPIGDHLCTPALRLTNPHFQPRMVCSL